MVDKKLNTPENTEVIESSNIEGVDGGGVLGGLSESAVNKISEVVGESASENGGGASKKTKTKKRDKSLVSRVLGLLTTDIKPVVKIPEPEQQKVEIIRSIKKRTNKLIKKAEKIQSSRNFSANQLENIVFELRAMQSILANLYNQTKEGIENLYRKYVLKKS